MWSRTLLLCLMVNLAWAGRDPNVCEVETESCGMIPPTLPKNFVMLAEVADLINKTLFWQELYYDHLNLRGKFVLISNSIEYHAIFDYSIGQVIQYMRLHPGVSFKKDPLSEVCVAKPIQESQFKYFFGYRNSNRETKLTHMFNSYEVMRFGGQYPYKYAGVVNLDERGLRTNSFNGCVYDAMMDATLATNYYFADNMTFPASASILSDGTDLASMPVLVRMNGTVTKPDVNATKIPYNVQESIVWFEGEPSFDYHTFKIPQGLYCKNYRGDKALPDFPIAFNTRRERTTFTQDADGKMVSPLIYSYETIWYNAEKGLARRDFTPLSDIDSDIYNKFGNKAAVKTIFDFNTGVVYVVGKTSGRCYARAIVNNDFFETNKEKEFIAMASPQEIFLMEYDKMEYKGKEFARNIETDVWAGQVLNEMMNLTLYMETSITSSGWAEESDDKVQRRVPIRHVVMTNREEDEFLQTVDESNFYKFSDSAPPIHLFDIYTSSCIDTIDYTNLGIKLELIQEDLDLVKRYQYFFLDATQYYLADIAQVVSPIRIQKLDILNLGKLNVLKFSVLEKPTLKTKVPFAQKGVNVTTAIENLQKYIDAGNFTIRFKDPQNKMREIKVNPGSLGHFKKSYAPLRKESMSTIGPFHLFRKEREVPLVWFDDIKPTAEVIIKKGMSPGGLAGLAIAMLIIGVGVGIGVMYLYIRRYSDKNLHDQYAMQSKR